MRAWFRWHRWCSAAVSVQMLIWLVTGLFFAYVPEDLARATRYRVVDPPLSLPPLAEHCDLLTTHDRHTRHLTLSNIAGATVAHVMTLDGVSHFIDLSRCRHFVATQEVIAEQARSSYSGTADIVAMVSADLSDFQPTKHGNVWVVRMNDDDATDVIIDAQSAEVIMHRTRWSSLSDWMFRLHFMDYSGTRGFNHPLIWAAALFALLLSLSGIVLLVRRYH